MVALLSQDARHAAICDKFKLESLNCGDGSWMDSGPDSGITDKSVPKSERTSVDRPPLDVVVER